ncbi:MAG: BatA domain-containing protein, partial [Candidatus Latescibacteria bacterium]|nr:BatA domain-containing protein [Candidatus Latescibacterota bacterium]
MLLSLATIPVIIHLIQRIRLRKISYSSLFFITQTNRETFSWLQVKEILLLIFRTLFVFFLLFSLARPYFVKKIYTSKSEASRLIILDDSYSMAYQNNFTRAKQTALKLIQELKKGSEAAFLTSSGSVKVNFTTDFFSLEKMIDTLRVSFSGRSLEPCFNKGLDIMSDAVQAQKDIYIITDLQKRALEPILERVNFISQESEYDITVVDVGKENHINVGIEEVFVSPNFPGPDFPSRPYVKVKNYSNQTSRRMLFFSLKFSEKESIIYSSQKEIVLNPYEVKAVIIETEISQPGKYLFEASLSRDSLPADDRYFYTVKIDEKKQVLLIRDNAQESQYLARALQTGDFVIA